MALSVELASLSEETLESTIREELPSGWSLEVSQDSSHFWVVVVRDADSVEKWRSADITAKQVLLHTIGWWNLRNRKANVNSPWAPRTRELTKEMVRDRALQHDPEDLDPSEVESVYSCPGGKRHV